MSALLRLFVSKTERHLMYYVLFVKHVWLLFFDMVLFLINSGIKDKNFMLHYEVRVLLCHSFLHGSKRASCIAFTDEINQFQGYK